MPVDCSSVSNAADTELRAPSPGAGLRPAVFLDRDGTLTEEVGYVNHVGRLQVFPWTPAAIGKLNRTGLLAIVVTNQSGVGRGYFPEDLVHRAHERIARELLAHHAHIDAFYYCPHHPDAPLEAYRQECHCRKPAPGMVERAAREFGIDVTRSYVVGDSVCDLQLAANVGARSVLVMTGYGRGNLDYARDRFPCQPDRVAENLLHAVEGILEEQDNGFTAPARRSGTLPET
jgi:D-glycero-D-manno-heptose 1,7-bisphosphate phosphatase